MNPFERAVEFVLDHEGGLSEDPKDPGGLTKFGISQRAYPNLDIRNLTREAAIELYRSDYWNRCKCGELPSPFAVILFDSAVNQGPGAAIRMLQKSLSIKVDGVMGPETIGAAHRANIHNTVCEFVARRAFDYAQNPNVVTFGMGWYRRLAQCQMAAMEPL